MVRRPRYWDSPSLSAGPRGQLFARAAASVALCAQGQGRHPSGAAGARNLLPRRVLGCAGGAQAPPACRLGARAPHACAWSTVVLPARRRPDARAQGARRGGPIKGAAFWQYIHDGQASAPRPGPPSPPCRQAGRSSRRSALHRFPERNLVCLRNGAVKTNACPGGAFGGRRRRGPVRRAAHGRRVPPRAAVCAGDADVLRPPAPPVLLAAQLLIIARGACTRHMLCSAAAGPGCNMVHVSMHVPVTRRASGPIAGCSGGSGAASPPPVPDCSSTRVGGRPGTGCVPLTWTPRAP